MKLLVVSSWFPFPPHNGAKLRAFHLVKELAGRHRLTLLSFAEPGEGVSLGPLGEWCERVLTVPGNPYKPQHRLTVSSLFSRIPRSYAQTYSPAMQHLIEREAGGHDAVVALQLGAAMHIPESLPTPRVLDEIEVATILEDYVRRPTGLGRLRSGLTWWKYSAFIRTLTRRFDRTTVASDREFHHLGELGCDVQKICVVPNGVDRSAFGYGHKPGAGRLIYPGSVTYAANLDAVRFFAGEILPRIRAVRPDVHLHVTGAVDGIDTTSLSAGGSVTFTGHVPEVRDLVARSCACVVPLRIGGGTRLKILEAAAIGTPVIATSKGVEGLALEPDRDILIADTPDAFAQATLRIVNDPALGARLARNARRVVGDLYTWDRIGAQLNDVVEQAVSTRRESNAAANEPIAATGMRVES